MFRLLSTQDPTWMSYITKDPQAMIFHHPNWINNITESYGYQGWIATEIENNDIVAGLPVIQVNSPLTGKRLIALPFSDYCVPLTQDPDSLRRLITSLIDWASQNKTPIEIRSKLPDMDGVEEAHDYVLHTMILDPDPDVVEKRISRRVRDYLHSAVNRNVRVEMGNSQEYLKQFYYHQLVTRRKHGLPAQPWNYFMRLGKNVLEKGLGFVMLAFIDERCLAGLVVLHWGQTMTLKYAASSEEYDIELRPNHILNWEAMRWGCEHGYKILDFGRSSINQVGLRTYKNRWGYQEEALDYSFIGSNPPKVKVNGVTGRIFIEVMRRSPLWFNKIVGDVLYAHFP